MATNEQWQLTLKSAELYELCPARYILGPWAPLLVETARLSSGERVLDVACGTGVVARAAAEHVGLRGRVVGIDLNPGMIAVAQSLPAIHGAPSNGLSVARSISDWMMPASMSFFANKAYNSFRIRQSH